MWLADLIEMIKSEKNQLCSKLQINHQVDTQMKEDQQAGVEVMFNKMKDGY